MSVSFCENAKLSYWLTLLRAMGANTSKTTPRAWREAGQLGADRAAAADVEDTALERLDEPDDDSEDKA